MRQFMVTAFYKSALYEQNKTPLCEIRYCQTLEEALSAREEFACNEDFDDICMEEDVFEPV